ncbi:MAG: crossover junction endodeoxyribonuclease RuvC [Bacteroidetes bacterium GWA2_32_17]|nr:MAG: crossover junction endodeoxyribonuclease RuvC [Bacteroidetes bacterium GWA2_32_17]
MSTDKIILGIDPGTNIMGYAIIEIKQNKPIIISIGVIELKKLDDHFVRLKHIFERISGLINEYHPDELAIEAPFYGKNVQSMLKLGRAQGTAIAAAISHSIPVFEYAPRKIKQSITGNGNAAKEQVASMLQKILKINEMPKFLDATDALGAAICHFFQNPVSTNKVSSAKSWKEFINSNPNRVKK